MTSSSILAVSPSALIRIDVRRRATTINLKRPRGGGDGGLGPFEAMKVSFFQAEAVRLKARDIASAAKMDRVERKHKLVLCCFDVMCHILDLPMSNEGLQLRATELIGDILVEFRDLRNALFYYTKGVSRIDSTHNRSNMHRCSWITERRCGCSRRWATATRSSSCPTKLSLYTKSSSSSPGNFPHCHFHGRYQHDTSNELAAYDNIGLAYYYIGNMDKAVYYHNRMMNRMLEPESREKESNIAALEKSRELNAYKRTLAHTTMFAQYKLKILHGEEAVLPHESSNRVDMEAMKKDGWRSEQKVLSPKNEGNDTKIQFIREAFRQCFLEGNVDYQDYVKERDNDEDIVLSLHADCRFPGTVRASKNSNPYANPKVQGRAQQYKTLVHHGRLLKGKLRIMNLSMRSRLSRADSRDTRNEGPFSGSASASGRGKSSTANSSFEGALRSPGKPGNFGCDIDTRRSNVQLFAPESGKKQIVQDGEEDGRVPRGGEEARQVRRGHDGHLL